MRRALRTIQTSVATLFMTAGSVRAEVVPVREYAPLGQPVLVRISAGETGASKPPRDASEINAQPPEHAPGDWLALIEPGTGLEIGRTTASAGEVDPLQRFATLTESPPQRALLLQHVVAGVPHGAATWLIPMWTPSRHESALTALVRSALRQRSIEPLERLLRSAPASIPALEQQIGEIPIADGERVFTGYRLLQDQRVRVKTSLGELEFSLRFDAAPMHASAFIRLVSGGFYDGTPIHRLVTLGPSGRPVLVQLGDPSGTGFGGAGERIPYEAATLRARRGTLSMARVPTDPDSASGQIIIALSDEEAASLESAATPFAELTQGSNVLDQIALVPVGARDPEVPASPRDRPLANLRIEKAWTVPAPPRDNASGTQETPVIPVPIER